jgi:hypothetical protein
VQKKKNAPDVLLLRLVADGLRPFLRVVHCRKRVPARAAAGRRFWVVNAIS